MSNDFILPRQLRFKAFLTGDISSKINEVTNSLNWKTNTKFQVTDIYDEFAIFSIKIDSFIAKIFTVMYN